MSHLSSVPPLPHPLPFTLSVLKIYEACILYLQLIYLVVCFHFFPWCRSFDSLELFSKPHPTNTHTLQQDAFHPHTLAGCHRQLREEQICSCHMLIYSKMMPRLSTEAYGCLFPHGCRRSDGDCGSTRPDDFSHPRTEIFLHERNKQLQHESWQTRRKIIWV